MVSVAVEMKVPLKEVRKVYARLAVPDKPTKGETVRKNSFDEWLDGIDLKTLEQLWSK